MWGDVVTGFFQKRIKSTKSDPREDRCAWGGPKKKEALCSKMGGGKRSEGGGGTNPFAGGGDVFACRHKAGKGKTLESLTETTPPKRGFLSGGSRNVTLWEEKELNPKSAWGNVPWGKKKNRVRN